MKISRTLFAAAALSVFAHPLPASAGEVFIHNGSVMEAGVMESGQFVVLYTQPRPGLTSIGVRAGTLLVTGRVTGGTFLGVAHRFRNGCAPLPYRVSGTVQSRQTFVLVGNAAQFGRGCSFGGVDFSGRDPQSVLVFDYVGGGAPVGAVPRNESPVGGSMPAGSPL